jgi:hypothetical protein
MHIGVFFNQITLFIIGVTLFQIGPENRVTKDQCTLHPAIAGSIRAPSASIETQSHWIVPEHGHGAVPGNRTKP